MSATHDDPSALLGEVRLDRENRAALNRLLATGTIGHAVDGPDGRMRADVHVPAGEPFWDPAVLVLPHGGGIDIDIYNDDSRTHCALMPSNGANVWIWLPVHSHGKVRLDLDGPGYYWYSSNVGKDEERGRLGAIVVLGDVTPDAE